MRKRKLLRGLFYFLICTIIIGICFSIFKGPTFLLVRYYYYKGYIKQNQGNLNGAISDFSKVIEHDKDFSVAYISRGSAYTDLQKYDLALFDYSEAIRLSPKDARPFAYRGRCYYEIDSLEKSLNDYDKAIILDGRFEYAYTNRALLKFTKLFDFSGACADLKRASELGGKVATEYLEEYCK